MHRSSFSVEIVRVRSTPPKTLESHMFFSKNLKKKKIKEKHSSMNIISNSNDKEKDNEKKIEEREIKVNINVQIKKDPKRLKPNTKQCDNVESKCAELEGEQEREYQNKVQFEYEYESHLSKTKGVGFLVSMKLKIENFLDSFFPSKKQLNDKRLQNRMKICILAVCLMWASSLKVAVYISTQAIKVPSLQMLYQPCKTAFQVALEEKEKFSNCIKVQLDQCKNELHRSIITEVNRVNSSSIMNTKILNRIKENYGECLSDHSSVRFSLEVWVDSGQSLPFDSSACSDEERQLIMSTVGDINLVRTEAIALTEEYSLSSQNTVKRVVSYAKVRSKYDQEYLNNHTIEMHHVVKNYLRDISARIPNPNLDLDPIIHDLYGSINEVVSCISARRDNYRPCHSVKRVYILIADAFDTWQEVLDVYKEKLDDISEKYQSYRDNVAAAFEIAYGFYEAVFNSRLNDWVLNGAWRNTDASKFWPETIHLPGFPNIDKILEKIPDVDELFPSVISAYEQFARSLNSLSYDIYRTMHDFRIDARIQLMNFSNFPGIPEDYNPPKYVGVSRDTSDLDSEIEVHSNMTKSFVLRSTSALDAFSKYTANFTPTETNIQLPSISISSMKHRISNIDISFENLLRPNFDFDLWFLKFASLSEMLYLLDFAFRIYFSIRLFFKYWDASSIKLPEVDVRLYKEVKNPFKMSNGRLIILLFTNPLIGALLVILVGTWIVTFVSSIYSPLYMQYINGCVPQNGNGTFMTANIYSTAYNFAYQDGSASLVKGLKEFDTERTSECNSLSSESATKMNNDVLRIDSFAKSMKATNDHMERLHECLDIDQLDEQFHSACCGKVGYELCDNITLIDNNQYVCPMKGSLNNSIPFREPGSFMMKNSCNLQSNESEWELHGAIFDCEVLSPCQLTCTGPHKEKLHRVTKECGCITEWFFHSIWLQSIISIIVYALLNASRIGFVDGLARVLWKSLHPGSFTVWATCDKKGKFMTNSLHTESLFPNKNQDNISKSVSLNEEIKKQINWNSFIFRMSGAFIMVVSLSLNMLWILLIMKIPDATKPKWLL